MRKILNIDWLRISGEYKNYLSVISKPLSSVLEQHPFNADVTTENRYLPNRPYRRQTRLNCTHNPVMNDSFNVNKLVHLRIDNVKFYDIIL